MRCSFGCTFAHQSFITEHVEVKLVQDRHEIREILSDLMAGDWDILGKQYVSLR